MNDDWISVSTKLPGNDAVLATDGDEVFSAWYSDLDKVWYGRSYVGDRDMVFDNVTHWRLLPDLPAPEGPFYVLKHLNGAWVLYKKHDNDCAIVGAAEDLALHLVEWLNRLWADK